ncbi:MAG: CBS domain-containing protein [Lewinellaceae bacterium]|nr:CBS domain-containing protein [Saprospiraceae bacterium]MCB9315012.1 CBS domain-containing protein [Lewinellaceae bacterium]MCB9329803.1 CBS domain-containing protein [Lewinellaceae bacterium]
MMNEPLHTIMTANVVTLKPNNTLGDAREIFMTKRIHHIPIIEDKKLVGLITSWDIFKLGLSAVAYQDMRVSEVMTTHLATLEPEQHIGAAAEVLMEHLFHAVPIVNDKHELVGIVTTYDVLNYEYKKEYPDKLDKFIQENM